MKVRILINDVLGRFKKGEIGKILPNDSTKYDYFIELPPIDIHNDNDSMFLKSNTRMKRAFYFYKNEVEVL